MSGLAAGIRLAHFDRRVCILERHYAFGGLNSYYKLGGREFDVGLHAVTNYTPPGHRNAPLSKLLRQLRISHEEFGLRPQRYSEIRFPDKRLRFDNGVELLTSDVADVFPDKVDAFRRLLADIEAYDELDLTVTPRPTRPILRDYFGDSVVSEMLLCPTMYYGNAEPHDMDFTQFVTLFKSLFFEGFARPREGVRRIIKALVRRFRGCGGGTIRMNCGVKRIESDDRRVTGLTLTNGETITADTVLSSAGYAETMRLCGDAEDRVKPEDIGHLTFVESIAMLDDLPQHLGHDATIVFFSDTDRFHYGPSKGCVDLRSGVICCPSNYEGHDDMTEGVFRVTWLANADTWIGRADAEYAVQKEGLLRPLRDLGGRYIPNFADHVVFTDTFTPRTIERFTGHLNGAVYGSPIKRRDGRTHLENLFLCGTDQGFLGIIGALLSGITVANLHVLADR